MNKKIKVGVLFGGRSTEHEVSLKSGMNVVKAINPDKYEVILIGIDKTGNWHLNKDAQALLHSGKESLVIEDSGQQEVVLQQNDNAWQLAKINDKTDVTAIDVIFPVLHGSYGEDGTMQGFLRLLDIPFVGPDVLGSAIAMDKDVAKRLMKEAGIPVAKGLVLYKYDKVQPTFEAVEHALGLPFFIKPANAGSSVGVSKVKAKEDYEEKLQHAFEFDNKVLVEEAIIGKELECAVLGNESPIASGVGEIFAANADFYSYDAKYISDDGAVIRIPADVPPDVIEQVRLLSVKAFRTLCCEGLSRVDFLYGNDGKLVINEINTLPGFTNISMYPQLWEAAGIPPMKLVDKLIQLAIARHERDNKLTRAL